MKKTQGFTLIELMLAMAFISVLLVAIAMTVIQMATIYNKGMTLKEVNQSARDIADDLRRTSAASQVFTVNADGSDSPELVTSKSGSVVVGGRLCLGTYTYIWNNAKALESNDANLTRTFNAGAIAQAPITFVKIADANKRYCVKNSSNLLTNKHISYTDAQTMKILLGNGDHNLGIQSISITTNDSSYDSTTMQRIYTLRYVIGTGPTSAMNANQTACLAPGTANANPMYCNVQQFSLVLRVGNTVN